MLTVNGNQTETMNDDVFLFCFQGDKGWPGMPGGQGLPGPQVG